MRAFKKPAGVVETEMAPAGKLLPTIRELNDMGLLPCRRLLAVSAIAILVVAFEGVGIAMLLPLLDFIQAKGDVAGLQERSGMWRYIVETYDFFGIRVTLLTLCLTVFALMLMRQATAYVNLVWRTQLRHDAGRKMSVRLFRSLFESNARHIQQFGTGSFAYLLATQVQAANALLNSFGQLWILTLTFIAYGSIILVVTPLTSVLALGVVALAVAGITRYVRKSGVLSQKLVYIGEYWTNFVTERYRGWRLIKLGGALDQETEKAREFTDRIYRQSVGLARIQGRIELIVSPIIILMVLAALYISVEYFSISIGVITLFVVIVMRLMPVARGLANLRQSIAVQRANLDRVMLAFHEAAEAKEMDDGTKVFDGKFEKIIFDDVTFQYAGGQIPALKQVSTDIVVGELTAVMGPSGAGKSTLIDLLPRLLTATEGTIFIDKTPIDQFSLKSLRQQIAYVSQEPLIFQGTVLENIRYLRQNATEEDVREACRIAFADDFIQAMPDQYLTILGEGGAGLSGGQRQRIALARAYLTRPSILILDEPTSALDYESEHEVQKALEDIARERGLTVIVIAHRLSTVRNADKLIVLVEGRLKESGMPEELSHSDSWYAKMLSLDTEPPQQQGENENPAADALV